VKGPIYGLVLAAGGSSRLGRPKQLVRLSDKPLVVETVEKLQDAGVDRVVVCLGGSEQLVRDALTTLDIEILVNPRWEEGIGGTIAVAISTAVNGGAAAALIALTDQPRVDVDHYRTLIQRYLETDAIVATGYPDGEGVPALFPRRNFDELSRLSGDRGGKEILVRYRDRLEVIASPSAAHDIDYPEDL
jgi:molybdenum cofactor cytidylyltransferase